MPKSSKPKPKRVIEKIPALSVQEGGDHYKGAVIEPIEFAYYNNVPFIEGCIIKHVFRHRDKGKLTDLLKAKHYLDMLIQFEYGYASPPPASEQQEKQEQQAVGTTPPLDFSSPTIGYLPALVPTSYRTSPHAHGGWFLYDGTSRIRPANIFGQHKPVPLDVPVISEEHPDERRTDTIYCYGLRFIFMNSRYEWTAESGRVVIVDAG